MSAVATAAPAATPTIDSPATRRRIDELLNRRPAVGMAVGVVRDGSLQLFEAHGLSDIASQTPVTEDTVFRVASITKTFTAIAVMQLVEQGLVDLDAPANEYLRTYQLVPTQARFAPVTVRHLLTHTSGIGEELRPADVFKRLFGEVVPAGRPVPSLAEYYGGRLRVQAEPGSRFVYTDHGFATLGQIVEDVSGQAFADYVRDHVFDPLGMTHSDLVRSERVAGRLATGYDLTSHGPRPVKDYEVITVAAGSAYSTPRDMARYLAALMSGGANEHGSVLKPETLAQMFAPQYQPVPRGGSLGLAFSRFEIGGHAAVEHEGVLPGFNSQIFVAPADRIGVMAFTNGARLAMLWLPAEVSTLLGHVLGVAPAQLRTDVPQHPEIWGDLCGWYPLDAAPTDMRLRMMVGLGVQVSARGGRLVARVLNGIPAAWRGFPLHPDDEDDPYVFRIDLSQFGIGTVRVAFSRGPAGVRALTPEFMPLSLPKAPAGGRPLIRAGAGLAIAGAGLAAWNRRRRRKRQAE